MLSASLEYAELVKNCKRLADAIVRLPRPTKELMQMAAAVKEEIMNLNANGRKEEAKNAIVQLRELLPFDIELICWEKEINEE